MRLIDANALTEDCKRYLGTLNPDKDGKECTRIHWLVGVLENAPTIETERKTDIIQKFHDYQIEWLKSHYDIELESQLEEMIVRFLHDTANCYMMNGGEQE